MPTLAKLDRMREWGRLSKIKKDHTVLPPSSMFRCHLLVADSTASCVEAPGLNPNWALDR